MTDGIGTSTWSYDDADRTVSLSTPQGTQTYGYDQDGNRSMLGEGNGSTIATNILRGQVQNIVSTRPDGQETTSFAYDDYGRLLTQTLPNGVVTTYGYDVLNRVDSIVHKRPDGSSVTAESYRYDAGGNLSSRVVDGVRTDYTYDAIDQLTGESVTGGSSTTYSYDANGNRLTKTVNGVVESYSYDDGDKLLSRSGAITGPVSYGYDACGRTTSVVSNAGTTTLSYDAEDRLTHLEGVGVSESYTYNGADARVGKSGTAGTRTYRRDGVGVSDPVLSDGAATMVPGISERLNGGGDRFSHLDRLGTSAKTTDASGAVIDAKSYDAFGLPTAYTNPSHSEKGFASAFGVQEDNESGLKLMGHRYYDPGAGRFVGVGKAAQVSRKLCVFSGVTSEGSSASIMAITPVPPKRGGRRTLPTMMRTVGSLSLMALAVGAVAQANFTIVRPVDNSRVREKVKILFPKGSVPTGGYVGIFLNGQLIDSMVPETSGKYLQYILDTKGRNLPDTQPGKPDRLEAKLYVNYNDQPRIVRTSSVDLNIANIASIKIPNAGFHLRYRYTPGTSLVYRMTQRVAMDTISEQQNALGGIAAELPLDTETLRLQYAVDNSYPNGDGLVRVQPLLPKGKDHIVLTTEQSQTPKTFYDSDILSVYMRLTPTGKEVFGSIPVYWPLEGTSAAGGIGGGLVAWEPLPSLPEKAVRPGDSWQTRFQDGKFDPEKAHNQTSVVRSYGPARGEFVNVEWESGHPCAKLHNVIQESQMSEQDKKAIKEGAKFGGDKIKVDETVWFALDTRQVIKSVRDITFETKQEGAGGMMGGGGYPGAAPGGGYPGGGGYPAGAPGGRGDFTTPGAGGTLFQKGRFGGGRGMAPGGPGFPGAPGGGGGGRLGANSGGSQANYIRIRFQQVFVLES